MLQDLKSGQTGLAGLSGLPAWRQGLIYATVAVMPLSFNLGFYLYQYLPHAILERLPAGLLHNLEEKKPLYFSPLDLLIIPLGLLLIGDIFRGRVALRFPPLPNMAWAVLALASITWIGTGGWEDWFKSAVLQTALMGVLAVWIFSQLADNPKSYRRLILVLGLAVGVCCLTALYQYMGDASPVRVSGWYEVRGQFAAQLAMAVPACVAFAVWDADPAVRWGAWVLAALGLCVCLSGGGFLAASAGSLAVAGVLLAAGRASRAAGTAGPALGAAARKAGLIAAGLLFITLVVLPRLPRENLKILWRSVSLYAAVETPDGNTEQVPTDRLRRYQAHLNLLQDKEHWKKGVGAGQFQHSINLYYVKPYDKPGKNTNDEAAWGVFADEPMTFGLFETTVVELGLLGLLLLAWVLFTWASSAALAFARANETDRVTQTLALAALGVAVGASVFSVFGSPLVRGCGGTMAFFLGLAVFLNRSAKWEGESSQ